jgi:hypothetical protein
MRRVKMLKVKCVPAIQFGTDQQIGKRNPHAFRLADTAQRKQNRQQYS